VSVPANIVSSVRSRLSDRKARRRRDNLISKIGELTYAQRIDPAISYETDIATLVEDIRHLERTEELRHRSDIADSDR
jgi:hypothetical protein